MVFSSVVFLFYFLPIVLTVAFGFQIWINRSESARLAITLSNVWLILASVVFYSWGEVTLLWVMLVSCLVNYYGGKGCAPGVPRRRLWLVLTIVANLGTLGWFKYGGMTVDLVNRLNTLVGGHLGGPLKWTSVVLPLGISFYTFHGISYVIDVWRSKVRPADSMLNFFCYYTLFPQLVAGPIVRYSEVHQFFRTRPVRQADLAEGARRFICGLGKKTLIANQVSILADTVFGLPSVARPPLIAWLGLTAYALQIYFDFSGYSDMAIGLGRMLGFVFPENFRFPYASRSIREYWRRWHMTLSFFYRDYLYIPLGGNRAGAFRTSFNLVLVFALCGLWHGASWNFVLWGLFHGFFLVAERVAPSSWSKSTNRWIEFLGHPYTFVVMLLSWVLFRCETWSQARIFYGDLFRFSSGFSLDALPWRAFAPDIAWAFAIGLVICFPLMPFLRERASRAPVTAVTYEFLSGLGYLLILVLSLLWIGAGSHNPFIYFRF
jgi:alginate O-acetyltransferase complex protein AlgI